jgi:hypothetical protein
MKSSKIGKMEKIGTPVYKKEGISCFFTNIGDTLFDAIQYSVVYLTIPATPSPDLFQTTTNQASPVILSPAQGN